MAQIKFKGKVIYDNNLQTKNVTKKGDKLVKTTKTKNKKGVE